MRLGIAIFLRSNSRRRVHVEAEDLALPSPLYAAVSKVSRDLRRRVQETPPF